MYTARPSTNGSKPNLSGKLYRKVRKEVVGHARARLQQLSEEVAEALRGVMNDPMPAPARVSAAKTVL